MTKKTIYIAGLGLIGASMALGIRRDHPEYEILGYNRGQASRDFALKEGMIDQATDDFASFAPLADVIILAVPIQQTIAFIEELSHLKLKEQVIISDAGSTKAAIVEAGDTYLAGKSVRFVGAHPMAGSHKTGAVAADVNLFENAYYIFYSF
ncbi:Prephenate dehydrogenase [Streptococcus sp. DD10]|nr:Prephenate dehydrogenase [Streptococcus sp. DD10]